MKILGFLIFFTDLYITIITLYSYVQNCVNYYFISCIKLIKSKIMKKDYSKSKFSPLEKIVYKNMDHNKNNPPELNSS